MKKKQIKLNNRATNSDSNNNKLQEKIIITKYWHTNYVQCTGTIWLYLLLCMQYAPALTLTLYIMALTNDIKHHTSAILQLKKTIQCGICTPQSVCNRA